MNSFTSVRRETGADNRMLDPTYRLVGVCVKKGKWRRAVRKPLAMANVLLLRLIVAIHYTYFLLRARRGRPALRDPRGIPLEGFDWQHDA